MELLFLISTGRVLLLFSTKSDFAEHYLVKLPGKALQPVWSVLTKASIGSL